MRKALVAFFSRTGRTRRMADLIAEGIRQSGQEAEVLPISEIGNENDLAGYDGFVFGCPTYFQNLPDEMKTFLFLVEKARLSGKVGGAFGSFTHVGSAARIIYDTMVHVFRMDMVELSPFTMKEQILDSGKAGEPCHEYGKAIGRKLAS